MKTFRILCCVAAAILSLTSCKEEEPQKEKNVSIVGQWELMDVDVKSIVIGDQTIEIFIDFKSDNTFALWQKIGEGRHREYNGTWTLTDSTLSGKYSDGKSWGSDYTISLDDAGNLHMAETKTGSETYIYRPCVITL